MENISCKILRGILCGTGDGAIETNVTTLIQFCTISHQCNKAGKKINVKFKLNILVSVCLPKVSELVAWSQGVSAD